jgi:hypothetical protein
MTRSVREQIISKLSRDCNRTFFDTVFSSWLRTIEAASGPQPFPPANRAAVRRISRMPFVTETMNRVCHPKRFDGQSAVNPSGPSDR